jgi:indolepyruvate ferredoxin oxidoreductase, beta subunit
MSDETRTGNGTKLGVVCAGIGGRGVLLASMILIETAVDAGLDAIASDELGMSQRGGSVVSLVKVGAFRSPLMGRESADLLIAFEESEFYRNLSFLKEGGLALVNTPKERLPEPVENLMAERRQMVRLVDADGLASAQGMVRSANMAVLGFLSFFGINPYTRENLEKTMEKKVSGKFAGKNLEIFLRGYEHAKTRYGTA